MKRKVNKDDLKSLYIEDDLGIITSVNGVYGLPIAKIKCVAKDFDIEVNATLEFFFQCLSPRNYYSFLVAGKRNLDYLRNCIIPNFDFSNGYISDVSEVTRFVNMISVSSSFREDFFNSCSIYSMGTNKIFFPMINDDVAVIIYVDKHNFFKVINEIFSVSTSSSKVMLQLYLSLINQLNNSVWRGGINVSFHSPTLKNTSINLSNYYEEFQLQDDDERETYTIQGRDDASAYKDIITFSYQDIDDVIKSFTLE